ncbi:hypothetical protein FO519_009959, partial [Halicephalobus sp. NKZ332]
RTKEFFETVDILAQPDYLADSTWTSIGDSLLSDFYKNGIPYFADILGLDKGFPAKVISMAKIPLTFISGKACQYCSVGLVEAQDFMNKNPWMDYALVTSCAGFLIVDSKAALLCTVPMLGIIVLLHHAPAKSVCNALPLCSDIEKRNIDPNEFSPNFNLTDYLDSNEIPDLPQIAKRSNDNLLGLLLDEIPKRSVDSIMNNYNQLPAETKLFIESKTSELINQGMNSSFEDFERVAREIISHFESRI